MLWCHCTHICHMWLSKNGCHIANMSHTAIMLTGHIDQTSLHECARTQPTEISTWHVIAMYVPETSMPLKCHILFHTFKLVHVQIWDNYVSIFASYELTSINNVTRSIGTCIFKIIVIHLWTNMPPTLQIYIPLHHYCSLQIDPHYCTQKSKKTVCLLSTKLVPCMCHHKYVLKCHIWKLVHVQIVDNYANIHDSYKLTAIKSVPRSTGIHIFNIVGTCPWTNMPATLHIYVSLHVHCSLYIDPILLHLSVEK